METHHRNKPFLTCWVLAQWGSRTKITWRLTFALFLTKLAKIFPPGFFNVTDICQFILCNRYDLEVLFKVNGCIHLRGEDLSIFFLWILLKIHWKVIHYKIICISKRTIKIDGEYRERCVKHIWQEKLQCWFILFWKICSMFEK